jgi:3',5'-cyclic-AMP phosphodiesterase
MDENNIKRRKFLKESATLGIAGLMFPFMSDNSLTGGILKGNKPIKKISQKGKILHRMIVVGDLHWGSGDITTDDPKYGKWANNITYPERTEKLISWLNKETKSKLTDFIVFNGDLVTNNPENLLLLKEKFSEINGEYFVVHGNHDHCSEEHWKSLWGYNRNHSFSLGDYGIVLLNSANENGNYECADHEWLKSQFKFFNDKTGILVFCHIFQHGQGIPFGLDCPLITDVMTAADNLKMVTYSHTHRLDCHYPIIKSAYPAAKNCEQLNTFFTGSFCSWGLPYIGYRVIEIYDNDQILTYAFDPENKLVINYNLLY